MKITESYFLRAFILFSIIINIISFIKPQTILAEMQTLSWAIMDTPNNFNNVIVQQSEVNFIAVGSDDSTIYAVDVANASNIDGSKALYKSRDKGSTWNDDIGKHLFSTMTPAERANFRIWNMAIAPDNAGIIAVVTNDSTTDLPRQVYISTNGGDSWDNTNLNTTGDNIGAIDISPSYGSNDQRHIAVGTRTGSATGSVYVKKLPGIAGWVNQALPPSEFWIPADVIALKFSPNYASDYGLVIIVSTTTATYLNLGIRDLFNNTTNWGAVYTSPGIEITTGSTDTSPGASEIVTADIELPSNFSASTTNPDTPPRRYYVSTYSNIVIDNSGVYRRDDEQDKFFQITPPENGVNERGISSIAYYGDYGSGKLLAGEVRGDFSNTFIFDVYLTSNPQDNSPVWNIVDKRPSGAVNPVNPADPPASHRYYANAQLAWSPGGDRAYCGTSSADLDIPPAPAPMRGWPLGYLKSVALDESAFSVSPYSYDYENRLDVYGKPKDTNPGNIWNQTGLIDTNISYLADVAALEVVDKSKSDYNILYLASSNVASTPPDLNIINYYDSIWRSATLDLGYRWERIVCRPTDNHNLILRVYSGSSYLNSETRSDVLVYADCGSRIIDYSPDEGQSWEWKGRNIQPINPNLNIKDVALGSDESIYAMDERRVRRCIKTDYGWKWGSYYYTGLDNSHTLYVLPEEVQGDENDANKTRWIFVGDEQDGRVAYSDIADTLPQFAITPPAPVAGNVHVFAHDKYLKNGMIYIGINDFIGLQGKMYRWTVDISEDWTQLEPPNTAFYGIALDRDALYGAWQVPSPPNVTAGVDRTLFSYKTPPPPLEWDDLTYGLPNPGDVNYGVTFTREPTALKISSNDDNTLWAIDNRDYDWNNKIGCLWYFVDTLAKRGPRAISPPSDAIIPVDPVTGRADQINFSWYPLKDAGAYELQLAKDEKFSHQLIINKYIIPYDQTSPSWISAPGYLEINHKYFWRVRASGSIYGEEIHSPYSATMYFTVQTGFGVNTPYMGPQLFQPENACGCPCGAPVSFSWSPYKETRKYKFELSENADLSNPIISIDVNTTSYKYDGKLKCNVSYFWRVRALEPFPSEWSATFIFIMRPTESAPVPSTYQQNPKINIPPVIFGSMIAIGVLLFICILILIRTRSTFINSIQNSSKDIRSVLKINSKQGRSIMLNNNLNNNVQDIEWINDSITPANLTDTNIQRFMRRSYQFITNIFNKTKYMCLTLREKFKLSFKDKSK